jgi:tetratricopeptide (TPR) repeat protein
MLTTLLSILLAVPLAAQGRVVHVDGTNISGTITDASVDQIEIQVGDTARTISPGEVLRLSFGSEPALVQQAKGFMAKLEFQNAVNLLTEAEGITDPAWVPPYTKLLKAEAFLAWSSFDKGRAEDSNRAFSEWLAAYPDHFWNARARMGQATALGRTGKVQDAAKMMQDLAGFAFDKNLGKQVELHARLTRCEVYLDGNEPTLARQRLEGQNGLIASLKTASSSPESSSALRNALRVHWIKSQILLGDAIEMTDGLSQAKSYWERLLRNEKQLSADVQAAGKIVIARAARDAGKLREAQFALAEIAATLNCGPDTMARALFALGEVCQELGDNPTPGTTYFRRVVDRFPTSSWAAKARTKLGN